MCSRDVEGRVRFEVRDALSLDDLDEKFGVVLDCGLFRVFDDADRRAYVESLASVLAPTGYAVLLCFSEREPGEWGPRRISESELRRTFSDGWQVDRLERAQFEVDAAQLEAEPSSGDDVQAWLAVAQRTVVGDD